MSIRSKIQALITAANAKTGESDTTLTDAVQTLVDGYGQGGGGDAPSGGGTNLAAVDVYVGDYLSATELVITTGAVNRYQRYIVGN